MPLAQGPRARADAATLPGSGWGGGRAARSQSWLPGRGRVAVVPWPTQLSLLLPAAERRAVGGTRTRVSAELRGLLSFKSSCARSGAKFCCGFFLPASLPAPAPGASAGRRPLPIQAQGPAGRGERGRAYAQGARLGEAPTSREPVPPPRPLSAREGRCTTPPTPARRGTSSAPPPTASLRGRAVPSQTPAPKES